MRPELLESVKDSVLSANGGSHATLTSEKAKHKSAVHGMGGVGKTTVAVVLVNDKEVRAAFDKILWVSVGQEPNVRELQASLLKQATSNEERLSADVDDVDVVDLIKKATTGLTVLQVLDDVWESKYEKPLNVIDPDTPSKLLVTTRIRGLVKGAAEVDVGSLSESEALDLLAATAGIDSESWEEEEGARGLALEVVNMCGRLALTVAIAGGMCVEAGGEVDCLLVETLREEGLQHQDDEGGEGMTVEDRVIRSSLTMISKGGKKKNSAMTLSIFNLFAAFPEDVAVPFDVFAALSKLITGTEEGSKKSMLQLRSSITTLLNYNLLKGSTTEGSGVFMHDIVRDYTIAQLEGDRLRELQLQVTQALLDARPEGGHPTAEHAPTSTLEGHVARHLSWHMRGALAEGEAPPQAWVAHEDEAVLRAVAVAVGLHTLVALCDSAHAAGKHLLAARYAWVAAKLSTVGRLSGEACADLHYRSADLLAQVPEAERKSSEAEILSLEQVVLSAAVPFIISLINCSYKILS